MKILYGKKVTLFPIAEADIEYLHFLLKHEGKTMGQVYFKDFDSWFAFIAGQILQGQMVVWTAWTKEGKASKKFGFISLSDFTDHRVSIHGFTDKSIMKGIVRLLKDEDKYTFAEDALRTAIDYVFNDLRLHKINSECLWSNVACRRLLEKCGFEREGRIREAVCIEREYQDIALYGLIKPRGKEDVRRQQIVGGVVNERPESVVQPETANI